MDYKSVQATTYIFFKHLFYNYTLLSLYIYFLCLFITIVIFSIFQDGTPTTKTFEHIASEIGAEEAEEVGVEHLLRYSDKLIL